MKIIILNIEYPFLLFYANLYSGENISTGFCLFVKRENKNGLDKMMDFRSN